MSYGCFNRKPYGETTLVRDGMESSWLPRMVEIPFRMSRDCQYTLDVLGQADKKCIGCSWRANGQADTGAGAPAEPESFGSGVVGIRDGQGPEVGESGAGGVQQSAGVVEEQGAGEPARAAEELEAKFPNAAIYRQVKEQK